ncbi:MAG: hypothetical protein MUO40_12920 [Anaerolineaceae bacterium]|nr:hypothetical protein [Anaerolineaceae bacterium]
MKKLFALLTVVFFAGFMMAQNTLDLDQTGVSAYWATGLINQSNSSQVGSGIDANIDQIAGTYNQFSSGQGGNTLDLTVNENAGTSNHGEILQSGNNGHIDIYQVAGTYNYMQAWQQSGLGYIANNDKADISQTAGTYNSYVQRQSGQDQVINLNQNAGTYNTGTVYQGQWGALETNNTLVGATLGIWGPLYGDLIPAAQTSDASYNDLFLDQNGSFNKVGLYQDGSSYNHANIVQSDGNNSLLIYQTNVDGFNSLDANQSGGLNSATVYQSTVTGDGTITVDQN